MDLFMIHYVYKTEIICIFDYFFLSMLAMKQYLVNKNKETLSIKSGPMEAIK